MLTGKQLGKYHLVRSIGSGGMGEIYLAEDSRIPRQVAIKVMHAEVELYPSMEVAEEAKKLFRREMRAITILNHPYILQLFDFGEECIDGHACMYLVMPWQEEGSLADWLQRRNSGGVLNLGEAAHFVSQAADALQHVHEHSLIHQDVKPTNFLVRSRSETILPDILLSDFGISKIMATSSAVSQNIRGTPAYMAPEQWQGHPVPATDQYALAVMTYVLLTGHFPFTGRIEQLLHQHLFVEPQPPSSYNPSIPPGVDTAILMALAKKPEERFSSILLFSQVFQEEEHCAGSDGHFLVPSVCILPAKPTGFSTEIAPSLVDNPSVDAKEVNTKEKEAHTGETSSSEHPIENASAVPSQGEESLIKKATSPGNQPVKPPPEKPQSGDALIHPSLKLEKPAGAIGKPLLAMFLLLGLIIASVIGVNKYQQDQRDRISSANARATADAALANSPSYMPDIGSYVFHDSLQNPGYWKVTNNAGKGGSCQFVNNALHVIEAKKGFFYLCSNELTLPNNIEFEVKMMILKGICGDVYIRYDSSTEHGYLFKICIENNKGQYAIRKYTQLSDSDPTSLTTTKSSPAIKSKLGDSNIIGIAINKGTMTLYINGQKVASGIDTSYSGGYIGLCADAVGEQTEVAFTDARLWEIKES